MPTLLQQQHRKFGAVFFYARGSCQKSLRPSHSSRRLGSDHVPSRLHCPLDCLCACSSACDDLSPPPPRRWAEVPSLPTEPTKTRIQTIMQFKAMARVQINDWLPKEVAASRFRIVGGKKKISRVTDALNFELDYEVMLACEAVYKESVEHEIYVHEKVMKAKQASSASSTSGPSAEASSRPRAAPTPAQKRKVSRVSRKCADASWPRHVSSPLSLLSGQMFLLECWQMFLLGVPSTGGICFSLSVGRCWQHERSPAHASQAKPATNEKKKKHQDRKKN